MKKRIRVQGFLIFLALAGVFFFSRHLFVLFRPGITGALIDICAVILILAGFFYRISARGIKAELNPDGKTLVVKGLYAELRNPMYFGTLLIGLGISVMLFRWWVAGVFLAIYLLIYIPQINREEAVLLERFGERFKNYCRRTPQLFPKIFGKKLTPEDGQRFKLCWVKKELNSLILTAAFIIALEVWKRLIPRG